MTIALTGGGSGGHITPVLAVAKQLKLHDPTLRVIYIGQRGDGLGDIAESSPHIDGYYGISAGKFRRYHGEGMSQLLDVQTIWLNIKDVFRVLKGFFEAYGILRREKPSALFVKGGFVGVPVGYAAALRRIPYVTHDSDAIPGLANRLVSPWAKYHAVALPKEIYRYPAHKTVDLGVPVADTFSPVSAEDKAQSKKTLGFGGDDKVLLVTGGGLGAERVNRAILDIAPELLVRHQDLGIIHIAGRANEQAVNEAYKEKLNPAEQGRVKVLGYTEDLHRYSAASDLVVTRAGATAIAEFAVQGKACLLIPSPFLAGGHQLKNAVALQEAKAVAVLDEKNLKDAPLVLSTISALLEDNGVRKELEKNIQKLAHPEAATELAELILKIAHRSKDKKGNVS